MKLVLILISILFILSSIEGCGEQSEQEAAPEQIPEEMSIDTVALSVTDTIGVFYGDTTLEFGSLNRVRIDEHGNIFALDGRKSTLKVFSFEGDLQETIGRFGSGPGEFQYPTGFVFLRGGGLLVSDFGGNALVFFDTTCAFDHQIPGFFPVAPVEPVTGPGNTFIAGSMDFQQYEDGYSGTSFLGRYTGEDMDPELIYRSYPLSITLSVTNGEQNVNVDNVDCVWESDLNGAVYFAVRSDSTYCVERFDPDANPSIIVEREWERIPKTEEELAEGVLNEGLSRHDDGSTTVRREEAEDLDLYHLAIETLSTDQEGNVWVGQGYTSIPTFEVYNEAGVLLRVVTIPELEGIRGLRFCFLNGMLAYDYAPVDYPKIYLLDF